MFKQHPTVIRTKGSRTPVYVFSIVNPEDYELYKVKGASTNQSNEELSELPEECNSPFVARRVFETWLSICKGQFVKPPTIEQCLGHYQATKREPLPMVTISPEEEEKVWALYWVPTHIEIESPTFRILWAPLQKEELKDTRIEIDEADINELEANEKAIEIHDGWLHDVKDLPLASGPPLQIDVDLGVQVQREKFRKRVREARLRAKLAKYRAEALAQRYAERFGSWPEEDLEEAQTEAENSSEDEDA